LCLYLPEKKPQRRRRPVLGDGLRLDPTLAEGRKAWHRYNAACYACLAAAGEGKDAARLDEQERLRLRRLAFDWLLAEFAAWEKVAEIPSGRAEHLQTVRDKMRHWQKDADLATVCGEALAKLSEAERGGWEKLWRDVDGLHRRAAHDLALLHKAGPSEKEGIPWRYTTMRPAAGWEKEDFDDSSWQQAPGGFGTRGTPGSVVRTTWTTADIWLRRSIVLPDRAPGVTHLLIHHDDDVEVYLNGQLVLKRGRWTTKYILVPLDAEGLKAVRSGRNTLAVHCHQNTGEQYIDVGLVSVREAAGK
jgi:hypothetical protein